MAGKILRKYGIHIFFWILLGIYLMIAPGLFTPSLVKIGKPIQTDSLNPAESDQISFEVEQLEFRPQNGERLYNLFGWAYILGQEDAAGRFEREIRLTSDGREYVFSAKTVARNPGPESIFAKLGLNLDMLGFSTQISEDALEPGRYRIGIIFRDPATGKAFYSDKPARYVVKTPNTLKLERK